MDDYFLVYEFNTTDYEMRLSQINNNYLNMIEKSLGVKIIIRNQ